MAKRPKLYYPQSYITEGLYTDGNQYMLEDGTEYIGQYHTYADGLVMTNSGYNEFTSERLVPYRNIIKSPTNFIYDTVRTNEDIKKYRSPQQHLPKPILADYKREYIMRYFVQRRNQGRGGIIEVTLDDFNSLQTKGSGLHGSLYKGLSLRWKINGTRENVIENGTVKYSISETNARTLNLKEPNMVGLKSFLGDPLEFSIFAKLTDKDILKDLDI